MTFGKHMTSRPGCGILRPCVSEDWKLGSENSQMVAEKPRFGDAVFARTRLKQTYLGVLCGGAGGRFSCKKESPGLTAGQKKQSFFPHIRNIMHFRPVRRATEKEAN